MLFALVLAGVAWYKNENAALTRKLDAVVTEIHALKQGNEELARQLAVAISQLEASERAKEELLQEYRRVSKRLEAARLRVASLEADRLEAARLEAARLQAARLEVARLKARLEEHVEQLSLATPADGVTSPIDPEPAFAKDDDSAIATEPTAAFQRGSTKLELESPSAPDETDLHYVKCLRADSAGEVGDVLATPLTLIPDLIAEVFRKPKKPGCWYLPPEPLAQRIERY